MPSGFNFRRFLSKAEDPLERLAELGREVGATHPARPFAEPAKRDAAGPSCVVPVGEMAVRSSGAARKKRDVPEVPDARNIAVWKRQQSPGIAGLFDRKF